MKKIRFLLTLISILLFVFACKQNNKTKQEATPAVGKYDVMAKELCICWQPLSDVNDKIEEYRVEGNKEAFTELFEELGDIHDDVDDCLEKLEKRFENVEDEKEQLKLKAALRKICPKVAKIIEQATPDLE